MRYTAEHKQETRERILRAAARQFRERGIDGTGVASVMKEAKLTHGGFYAHFESKDELVTEVIRHGFRETAESFAARFAELPPKERLKAWVRGYLSEEHRAHPDVGCPFATVSIEAGRGSPAGRSAMNEIYGERLRVMAGWLPDVPRAEAERRVMAATSQVIGALMMSRTLDDQLARRTLDAAADAAISTLFPDDPPTVTAGSGGDA